MRPFRSFRVRLRAGWTRRCAEQGGWREEMATWIGHLLSVSCREVGREVGSPHQSAPLCTYICTRPPHPTNLLVDMCTRPPHPTNLLVDICTRPPHPTNLLVDICTRPPHATNLLVNISTRPPHATNLLVDICTRPPHPTNLLVDISTAVHQALYNRLQPESTGQVEGRSTVHTSRIAVGAVHVCPIPNKEYGRLCVPEYDGPVQHGEHAPLWSWGPGVCVTAVLHLQTGTCSEPSNSPDTLPLSLFTPTKHLAMSICPLRRAAQTALLPSPSSCFRSTPCSHRYWTTWDRRWRTAKCSAAPPCPRELGEGGRKRQHNCRVCNVV